MPETLLEFDSMGAKSKGAIEREQQALEKALTTGAWPEYYAYLSRSLLAFVGRDIRAGSTAAVDRLAAAPSAALALSRCAFIDAIGDEGIKILSSDSHRALVRWIMTTPRALDTAAASLVPEDRISGFFKVWSDIWTEDPLSHDKYLDLAIAVALVFDENFSPNWNGKRLKIDPWERYMYYQKNSENGKLTGKIHQMKPSELIWVVCAPVPESELDWALRKMSLNQKSWGNSYGMIKYLMERAVNGLNPYKEYTLAEILKEGGICMDQAYFTVNTARAHGIPAAGISGDGKRGPHAWATWMADEGEWHFTGRFEGYPAGDTPNPQSQIDMSEEEFARLSERRAETGVPIAKARQLLWLAGVCVAEPDKAGLLIELAVQTADKWPPAWKARLAHWSAQRATAPVEEWRKLVAAAKKEFRENTAMLDLVRKAETAFIFPRQDPAVTMADLKRDSSKARIEMKIPLLSKLPSSIGVKVRS